VIGDELRQLVSASSKNFGLGVIISIAIGLWSGVRGMRAIMMALNIAYGQPEGRSFIRFNATALLLTVVAITGGLIALALVTVLPLALSEGDFHGPWSWIGLVIEWPILIICSMGMLGIRTRPEQARMEMGFAGRNRRHDSVGYRIDLVHYLPLPLWQLQQNIWQFGRAAGSADMDVVIGVRGAVRCRDKPRG
jgi:hypothetical protein